MRTKAGKATTIDRAVPKKQLLQFTSRNEIVLQTSRCDQPIIQSNNACFEVQRFVARDYDWITLGFVEGNGTATASHPYQFIDKNPVYGEGLYRLRQINTGSSWEISNVASVLVGDVPPHPVLHPGFPNPFIDEVTLGYSLPDAMHIQLAVYEVLGREVLRLHDSWISAGYHQITFGETLRRGTYFVKLQSPAEILSIRITKR